MIAGSGAQRKRMCASLITYYFITRGQFERKISTDPGGVFNRPWWGFQPTLVGFSTDPGGVHPRLVVFPYRASLLAPLVLMWMSYAPLCRSCSLLASRVGSRKVLAMCGFNLRCWGFDLVH